jgi:hypothetical protein
MSKVPFPPGGVSEVTIFRVHSPKGLFAYRYSQALGLLRPLDYGGGDLSREDRRKALDQSVVLHRPLTALVVFLSVVALEDLIRGLGNRLARLNGPRAAQSRLPKY